MPEHRVILEPAILRKLGENMQHIALAWENDVTDVRAANAQIEHLNRELNAAVDRARSLAEDLMAARQENADLIRRNAYLEAQVQRLYESSLDARDTLSVLADRAVESAKSAPRVEPAVRENGTTAARPAPAVAAANGPSVTGVSSIPSRITFHNNRFVESDGTGLPPGKPEFLRREAERDEPRPRATVPMNEFARSTA